MEIAVAGGTGIAGSEVVRVAQQRGHRVRVLTRGNGVDVHSGEGLDDALSGADTVIDVLSTSTQSARVSTEFFTGTTSHLLAAGRRVGVGHHLALSIVGVDRAPHGYYAGKLAQEQAVQSGQVRWTIQRATQFHDFASQIFRNAAIGPVHPAVRMRTQPVSIVEVATRLVDLAEAGPSGRVPDIAGPREEQLADMIRAWAEHIGHRGWMPSLSLPGAFGRAIRDGRILPGEDADLGTVTFADWLNAQPRG
ncbi:SDR family oxidoreductase [Microbacterium sp. SD291]|uniref:SDR family oxidoreductase n=1 Tax=Microbacterium sp. SD291 TaxID=2782007 RepID=UPI001A970B16|nr:SDR family oxidoreductase [Microbacterium sp. SD291]MBO0979554.1 SDR family oxidoreductase [Microbacterium sp. SD291]